MNPSIAQAAINAASPEALRVAISLLLAPTIEPAFGSARPVLHEVAAIRALQQLGALPTEADEYQLMLNLRITRAKARALLYQLELRQFDDESSLDARVISLLDKPLVERGPGGETVWLLEVTSPLVLERIRQLVRQIGFLSDGSFSPSVIKLSRRAFAALIVHLMPKDRQIKALAAARQAVRRSEMPVDLTEWVAEALSLATRQAGKAAAGKIGELLVEEATGAIGELIRTGSARLFEVLR